MEALILFLVFTIFQSAFANVLFHASTYNLHQLLTNELKVLSILRAHSQTGDWQNSEIERYLGHFAGLNLTKSNVDDMSQNPLGSFCAMRRLSIGWDPLMESVVARDRELAGVLRGFREEFPVPSVDDVSGAALAVIRLQEVYAMDFQELINGHVPGSRTTYPLSAMDCLTIAHQAFFSLSLDSAEEWLRTCASRFKASRWNGQDARLFQQLESVINSIKPILAGPSMDIVLSLMALIPGFPKEPMNKFTESKEAKEIKAALDVNYKQLCRTKGVTSGKGLQCKLERIGFRSILRPWKVEQLSLEPFIVIFHDVLTDNTCSHLKDRAIPLMELARVQRSEDGAVTSINGRVGKMAWLVRNSTKLVERLYLDVEDMTGLSAESAEDLQVMNYGVGGHYVIHQDFLDSYTKELVLSTGDRIATVLFYLNDVTSGGNTVFPPISVSVVPQRGSAVFWYNLLDSGRGDFRTLHAGCPLVLGEKWIANLWLHERGQEFKRPCLRFQ